MATLITAVGGIIILVGFIMLLVSAFRESVWWGLVCFLPFGPLVFLILHWDVASKSFLIILVGHIVTGMGLAARMVDALPPTG